ncbi:MAG: glycosyltransferase family 4 protein [Cyclobacteriaceae bacterium]|nr:glycosyltransferase family 4 protein [Cyclobacteriaceae bacterium]MDW8331336.1 glycosyltransferase family 4 protein [Cyclobacteriaceae bacterium]
MKRILIIDNSAGITGAFRVMLHVAHALRGEFSFYFAVPKGNGITASLLKDHGFPYIHVNFIEIGKNLKSVIYFPALLYNAVKLHRYCKKNNITIIHVNDIYNMTGVVLKILNPNIKLIHHIRLTPQSYAGVLYRTWLKILYYKADQIIVVSNVVKKEVIKTIHEQKVEMLYDFISLPEYRFTEEAKTNVVRFLYPANFTPGKGHAYAVEAFRKALRENNHLELTFAGDDFDLKKNQLYKKSLINDAADLIDSGKIQFKTGIREVPELYANYDVVLNFSESESFSMTCYEAAWYGLPVIATRCGGPEEIVVHGESGFLVNRGDVDAMANHMLELATDHAKRLNMKYRCRELIHQRASDYNTVGRYRQLYERS